MGKDERQGQRSTHVQVRGGSREGRGSVRKVGVVVEGGSDDVCV